MAKAPRSRGDVVGVIDPRLLYDTEAVMAYAGIGEIALRDEKKAGRIKGYRGKGGRMWYRGQDIIDLITSEQPAQAGATA